MDDVEVYIYESCRAHPSLKPCVHCAKAKAKQRRTVKASESENKATKPGGRVFLDLSKVTVPKADITEFVRNNGASSWTKFLALQTLKFKLTSHDTPQHNNLAELAFPYLTGRVRAMMGAAWIPAVQVTINEEISWADEVEAQDEQVESEAGGNATVVAVAPVTTCSRRTVSPVRVSRYITEISNSIVDNVQEMLEVMKVATEFGMVDIDLPISKQTGIKVPDTLDLNSCYLTESNPVTGNNQPELGTMDALFDDLVGAGVGVGGGFDHTDELKVMNYLHAMKSPDREAWKDEIKNKYDRFQKYKVFKVIPRSEVPKGTKILSTTWAMKKKSNGKLRGRLTNVRGFEQLECQHYMAENI
eukprot:scaffold361015_cov103-Cyclotella_meneghiniana.AAC.2